MIPEGWQLINLYECLSQKPQYGANASSIPFSSGMPRYIRITDIKDDGNLTKDFVSLLLEESYNYILKDDDFLIARSGNTVGKSFLYQEEKHGFAAYAGYLIRFVLNKEIILPTYLKFYAQSDKYWLWVKNTVRSGAQPNINSQEYSNLKLLLPPLPEQRKIAEILSTWDKAIALLEQLITAKRKLKQGLMQQLLTGKKRFKVYVKSFSFSTSSNYFESKLGEFPDDWEIVNLPDILFFQEGPGVQNNQFTKSGVKLLNGSNIQKGELILDNTSRYISESEAYGRYQHFLVDADDLVIASSGISVDKFEDKIAFVCQKDLPLCMNTSTIRFKVTNQQKVDITYFKYNTSHPENIKQVENLVNRWYRERAQQIYLERYQYCTNLVAQYGIQHDRGFELRTMHKRWGSCTKEGKIILNPMLVLAPKDCIDYVIIHELCHIRIHNHSQDFYKLLETIIPDWKERKHYLNTRIELRSSF